MEKESDKGLKKFGLYFGIGMMMLFFIGFKHLSLYLKIVIITLSCYHFLFSFLNPSFLKPTYFIISKIGFFVGDLITKIFLLLFFYFLFTPIAIILRLLGKDEIKRKSFSPQWEPIDEKENYPERVEKLY